MRTFTMLLVVLLLIIEWFILVGMMKGVGVVYENNSVVKFSGFYNTPLINHNWNGL